MNTIHRNLLFVAAALLGIACSAGHRHRDSQTPAQTPKVTQRESVGRLQNLVLVLRMHRTHCR
jgi:hypothetical protein